MNIHPEPVLKVYQELSKEQLIEIGVDFCIQSLKKFSLSHSIKNFSILLKKLVETFGLNPELIHTFVYKKRLS